MDESVLIDEKTYILLRNIKELHGVLLSTDLCNSAPCGCYHPQEISSSVRAGALTAQKKSLFIQTKTKIFALEG